MSATTAGRRAEGAAAPRPGRWLAPALVAAVLAVLAATPPPVAADPVGPAPSSASTSTPGPTPAQPTEDRYLVRYADDADAGAVTGRLDRVVGEGLEVEEVIEHVFPGAVVSLTPEAAAELAGDPRVVSVEPEGVGQLHVQSSAPWGLDRSDQRQLPLSGTYAAPNDGRAVTVYVVDSGARADHQDFGGRLRAHSVVGPDGSDCIGHGTHTSGTVGGAVSGMAKGVSLVAVRITGDCSSGGTFSTTSLVQALDWVASDLRPGVPAVVNLSLGVRGGNQGVDQAVQALLDRGVTVVASAGNSGDPACNQSPARVPGVITVAATDRSDASPSWSSYGTCVDLFAPGVGIASASHASATGYAQSSGTSMAAPHVSGAVALHLAQNPWLSPAQVTADLLAAATPDLVGDAGTGSPNRLLHVPAAIAPSCPPVDGWVPGRRPADDQLVRLYQAVFGRTPDEGGQAYWLDQMAAGLPLAGLAAEFMRSPEWQARYGRAPSDRELVDGLYRNVFGRAPDAAGQAYWLDQLAAGLGRVSLLLSFTESTENTARTATTPAPSLGANEVFRLYRAVFGRAPDDCGFAYWGWVRRTTTPLYGIASSFTRVPEWSQRYGTGTTAEELVDRLYANVLGRAPDAGGRAHWIGVLRGGTPVVDVLLAFSESPENVRGTGTLR